VQLLDHFRSDSLRRAILRPAMHHAMPHRVKASRPLRSSIQSIRMPTATVCPAPSPTAKRCPPGPRFSPARWPPGVQSAQSRPPEPDGASPRLEQRELDARRAAIDRQDAWLAGVMDDSFVILQSERSQFRARGPVIRVKNASNPQTLRDLDEHRGVFDIDTCRAGAWAMSSASRKMSASGLRMWTKQEEMTHLRTHTA